MCPGIPVGGTFWINDIQYTKVDNDSLSQMGGDSRQWSQLPTVCTTGVTDMGSLFKKQKKFNEDISSWDTSSVTDMSYMCVPPRSARWSDALTLTCNSRSLAHSLTRLLSPTPQVLQGQTLQLWYLRVEHRLGDEHGEHVLQSQKIQPGHWRMGHELRDEHVSHVLSRVNVQLGHRHMGYGFGDEHEGHV